MSPKVQLFFEIENPKYFCDLSADEHRFMAYAEKGR